jgi:hypothetical protein
MDKTKCNYLDPADLDYYYDEIWREAAFDENSDEAENNNEEIDEIPNDDIEQNKNEENDHDDDIVQVIPAATRLVSV